MVNVNKFLAAEQEDIAMIRLYFRMFISSRLK